MWLGSPIRPGWSPAFRRFRRWLCQPSPASRLKAGLQLIDPKTITASPCRVPNQADSTESRATENGEFIRDDFYAELFFRTIPRAVLNEPIDNGHTLGRTSTSSRTIPETQRPESRTVRLRHLRVSLCPIGRFWCIDVAEHRRRCG